MRSTGAEKRMRGAGAVRHDAELIAIGAIASLALPCFSLGRDGSRSLELPEWLAAIASVGFAVTARRIARDAIRASA